MFGAYGSVGSNYCGLDVAKDGVDPFEARVFRRFRSAAGLDGGMGASCLSHAGKAAVPIRCGVNACLERRGRKSGDRRFAESLDAAKDDLIGFAIAGRGNGGHERRFPSGAAPASSGTAAAQIGVVHWTSPFNRLAALRSSMTWASLCLSVQAVVCVTPSRRPSSMLETPFLD